jgi:hypothetical protein
VPPHKAPAAPGLDACLLPPLAMRLRLPQVLLHNFVLRVAATLGCCRYTHGNRLTGGVPAQWAANGSFTNLKELTVSGNPLGGALPVEWGLGPQAFPSLQVSHCAQLRPCRPPAGLLSSSLARGWATRPLRTFVTVESPRHLHLRHLRLAMLASSLPPAYLPPSRRPSTRVLPAVTQHVERKPQRHAAPGMGHGRRPGKSEDPVSGWGQGGSS